MGDRWTKILGSDIFSHLITLKYLPRWMILSVDILITVFSYIISTSIIYSFYDEPLILRANTHVIPAFTFIFVQIFFYWLFHTYSGVLRYSTLVDTAKLFLAVAINALIFLIANFIAEYFFNTYIYDYIAIFLYGILTFSLLFAVRLIVKSSFDYFTVFGMKIIPIMIYGSQSDAIHIATTLSNTKKPIYKLIGFIDTEKEALSKMIMGVRVYKLSKNTVKNTISRKVKQVIISPSKMESASLEEDVDLFIENGITPLTVTPMSVGKDDSKKTTHTIKSIQIEDLLERSPINISTENISNQIKNKVILITGAAGSIGSEIVKQVIKFNPKKIILIDQAETPLHDQILRLQNIKHEIEIKSYLGDIKDAFRMEHIFKKHQPDVVFHAAAYKHVPMIEDNPTEGIQTNIKGTKMLADLSVKYNVARFVMISSDKAVNPTNIMGATKRVAEIYVQSLNNKLIQEGKETTKFITTRFGNVLGSNGSVIPLFKSQIEKMGPLTVTHPEIIRYFMTIPEACMLVLEAGTVGNGGEIYIFDMGSPVKIVDLAKKMIRLAGYVPGVDIQIEFTGLRPGEKLYEELLNVKEITKETHHPKILIANVDAYDFDEIITKIDQVIECGCDGKRLKSVALIKAIVPEFNSNNPRYEEIDNELLNCK